MTTDPSIYMEYGTNLLCEDATYRYAVWYTAADECRVGKQPLAGGAWQTYQFAGAARTALDMPVEHDIHNYPSIGIDSSGRLHVIANMHNDAIHYVRSTAAGDITSWAVGPSPAGIGTTSTYPTFLQRPDGSLRLYLRDVGWTGRGNGHVWDWNGTGWTMSSLVFQGLSVPNAKGPGIVGDSFAAGDTLYNWNPYTSYKITGGPSDWVEHWYWIWRSCDTGDVDDPCDREQIQPSYAQYRSATGTWHNVEGTLLSSSTFDPINSTQCFTGMVPNPDQPLGSNGYLNWNFLTIRADGYPEIIQSQGPWYRMWYDASGGWQQTRMGNALPSNSWAIAGISLISVVKPVWLKGELWYLATGYSGGGTIVKPRLWKANGTTTVLMGGDVGNSWGSYHSQMALDRRGVIEILTPDGDTPFVMTFGKGHRAVAA